MEETSAKVIEVIELAPIARAHGLEKHETTRLNKHFTQIYEKGFHLDILQSVFGSVSWASFQIFQLICLIFTGILALQGRIQPGDVVMYQTYFTTIVNSVSGMITLIPTISKGMESITSIGELLIAGDVETYHGKKKSNIWMEIFVLRMFLFITRTHSSRLSIIFSRGESWRNNCFCWAIWFWKIYTP